MTQLWIGTYPVDGPAGAPGRGEGIWRLDLDPATGAVTGAFAAPSPAPSFLATGARGGVLYAVGETTSGTVACFDVRDGGLVERVRVGSGGDAPCHLLVDPAGRALYVSNYLSGTVGVLPLAPDGGFAAAVIEAGGPVQVLGRPDAVLGPVTERRDAPHAHSALLAPGGAHLLVADLGTDELRRYAVGPDGLLADAGVALRLPAGTGPRHLATRPDVGPGPESRSAHLYLVGELDSTVHVLAWDRVDEVARVVQTLPARGGPTSGTTLHPAHVVATEDRVLVSVRGADVLAELAVHDGGARLEHRDDTPVGASPRHFAVLEAVVDAGVAAARATEARDVPRWVVTAAQDSGRVTVCRWDRGGLGDVVGAVEIPFPACVVPAS